MRFAHVLKWKVILTLPLVWQAVTMVINMAEKGGVLIKGPCRPMTPSERAPKAENRNECDATNIDKLNIDLKK